jgi:DNA integrity scanning protein DisA with diadenylate cyclase activity
LKLSLSFLTGLLACFLLSTSVTRAAGDPILPNAQLTPGAVMTTDANVICHRSTSTVRNVPDAEKVAVYKEYNIVNVRGEHEVDHLISLELGGSNDIKNLWPQSYKTMPYNAHVKDKLENRLHVLICTGKMSVTDAQQGIAKDWVLLYNKIFTPLK